MSDSDLLLCLKRGYEATDREKDSLTRRSLDLESEYSDVARDREEMKKDLEVSRQRIQKLEAETKKKSEFLSNIAESMRSVLDRLLKAIECSKNQEGSLEVFPETEGWAKSELEEESMKFWEEKVSATMELAKETESKIKRYMESSEKKKMELEISLESLKEENRDISALLRVAISEKEAAERKLKGLNVQKGAGLLQIAERGLQRVGLGFGFGFGFGSMVGGGSHELSPPENSGIGNYAAEYVGDSCEEGSLALKLEKTMKNLRLEISQLRTSLEESRYDNERSTRLIEEHAQTLAENALCICNLRDRERNLAQNVDGLVMELRETEAEVCRWREACELEVEAGRHEVEERDRLILIMKIELEKTKSALAISEGKLKLKEELAKAAMAAEEAAEKSLRLADRRATELISRIEQLTGQLEEAESAERNNRKLRRILCWPWRAITDANAIGMLLGDTRAYGP